jgi:hypothetical protein
VLKDCIQSVRTLSTDRDHSIVSLRVINEIAGDAELQNMLQDLKGVESVFFPLNQFSTDRDVIELSGNILKQLGSEEIAKCSFPISDF